MAIGAMVLTDAASFVRQRLSARSARLHSGGTGFTMTEGNRYSLATVARAALPEAVVLGSGAAVWPRLTPRLPLAESLLAALGVGGCVLLVILVLARLSMGLMRFAGIAKEQPPPARPSSGDGTEEDHDGTASRWERTLVYAALIPGGITVVTATKSSWPPWLAAGAGVAVALVASTIWWGMSAGYRRYSDSRQGGAPSRSREATWQHSPK